MARIISFEGRKISVPDDATDDEVSQIIEAQSPQEQSEPKGTTATGLAKSAVTGLAQGVASLAGLPGDIREGVEWLGGRVGLSPESARMAANTIPGLYGLPTSGQINDVISSPTGGYHQPQSQAEEYAQTIASFAPAAVAPGSWPAKIARVVVPGAASQAGGDIGQAVGGDTGEAYGRVIGGLAGGGALGVAEGIASAAKRPKVPTTQELKKQGSQAYQVAEQAGAIVAKDSFKGMVANLEKDLAEAGIDQTLHPKAMAALKRLQDTNENVTLKGVDLLRRIANGAAQSVDKDERRIARIIKDHIDSYVENLQPSDLVAGDATKATGALKEARDLWARGSKGEIIDSVIQRAKDSSSQFSGSGYENALRTQFRQLAKNERAMRRFSKDEQAAIRKVADGGPVENTLRMMGKLAPTGVVSGGIGATLGYSVAGPAGAVAVPAAGAAARVGATAMTARNAKRASEFMRRGGPAPSVPIPAEPAYDAAISATLGRQDRLSEPAYADRIRSLSILP
jgi:hypothetical protein